jgi:hypothetical protein
MLLELTADFRHSIEFQKLLDQYALGNEKGTPKRVTLFQKKREVQSNPYSIPSTTASRSLTPSSNQAYAAEVSGRPSTPTDEAEIFGGTITPTDEAISQSRDRSPPPAPIASRNIDTRRVTVPFSALSIGEKGKQVNKTLLESIPIIHSDSTAPRESGTQDMTPVDNSSPSSRWVTREELDSTIAPIIQSNHSLAESVQRMETTNHTLSESVQRIETYETEE